MITVGHHQLRFVEDQVGDAPQDEFEKTMVIEPSGQMQEQLAKAAQAAEVAASREAAAQEGTAPPTAASSAKVADFSPRATQGIDEQAVPVLPQAKLQVLSGTFAGRELELNKALATLGRPGIQVAAITRRAEGFYIVHVESGEGEGFPQVNGREIGPQAQKLVDNDVIQLAGVKMGFFMT